MRLHFLILLMLFGLMGSPVSIGHITRIAQTQTDCTVFGTLREDVTWEPDQCNAYVVTGNLMVPKDVTLTIRPGTRIQIAQGFGIEVAGTLIARGTPRAPIIFTSNQATPGPGDWRGLVLTETSTGAQFDAEGVYLSGTILQYAVIEYAGHNGLDAMFASITGYALESRSRTLLIDHTIIRETNGTAILAAGDTARITNNLITKNGATGLDLSYREIILTGNIITENGQSIYDDRSLVGGVELSSDEWAFISNNLIANNYANMVAGGIRLSSSRGNMLFVRNFVQNNEINDRHTRENVAGGLVISSYSNDEVIEVRENIIRDNIALSTQATGGVEVAGRAILRDNILLNNLVGEGVPRDLACWSQRTLITATDNYWGVNTSSAVEQRIMHYTDQTNRCQVAYEPFLSEPPTIPTPAPAPGLVSNHLVGQPGSTFVFYGGGFPASRPVDLFVNDLPLGVVQSDREGYISFQMTTDQDALRSYRVRASVASGEQALTGIRLEAEAPLQLHAVVEPSFVLATAIALAPTIYTPTPTLTPLPAGYQEAIPEAIQSDLATYRLVSVTNASLAGSYMVNGLIQNLVLEIHEDGRIYLYDLTTMLVTGKPTITMKGSYKLEGNYMLIICPLDSPYCGFDIRRTGLPGFADAWFYLLEGIEAGAGRGIYVRDGQTNQLSAFTKISDSLDFFEQVADPNPPPPSSELDGSPSRRTPTVPAAPVATLRPTAIKSTPTVAPLATTIATAAVSSAGGTDVLVAPTVGTVPLPAPATTLVPAQLAPFLPWAYRGLLAVLGLLWVVVATQRRQHLVTSFQATFQSGSARVRQLGLEREQAQLEQQLAQATAMLGKHVWEQQIVHQAYLPLFEQLAQLFQQRSSLLTEQERLETASQQAQASYEQLKADYTAQLKAVQEQQKTAVLTQKQARSAVQTAEKQIERLYAEQQQVSAEIQSMRQRLLALGASTAPDREAQIEALHNGIATLEQRLSSLQGQTPVAQRERDELQTTQTAANAALNTAEQTLAQIKEAQRQALTPLDQQRDDLKGRVHQIHEAINACTLQVEAKLSELGSHALQVRPEAVGLAEDYARIDQLQQQLRDRHAQVDLLKARQAGIDRSAPRTVILILIALGGTVLVVLGAIWWF